MTDVITADVIEDALKGAVPAGFNFDLERSKDTVYINLTQQDGIPWDLSIGWEGEEGEGEHLLCIFSDLLKYEEFSIKPVDRTAIDSFSRLVNDLLTGTIVVEITRFRSNGKLWRTRLIDCRLPEREQVVHQYYRNVLHWWRPVWTEIVRLGRVGFQND